MKYIKLIFRRKNNILFRKKNNLFPILFSLIVNSTLNPILYVKWRIYKKIKRIDQPVIHIHTICWNEEKLIPHYMRHYSHFVSHFYIYDNYSDDHTDELLKGYKNVSVIKFDTNNKFNDDTHQQLKNKVWKKSIGKADWVIVNDLDEFLYFDGQILDYLKKTKYTIFQPKGIDMYSTSFPDSDDLLINQIKTGVYNERYDKPLLFNPYKIIEINYLAGAHGANPLGIVRFNRKELTLLHYKYLSLEYLIQRTNIYRKRLSQTNIEKGYAIQYLYEDQKTKQNFEKNRRNAVKVIN